MNSADAEAASNWRILKQRLLTLKEGDDLKFQFSDMVFELHVDKIHPPDLGVSVSDSIDMADRFGGS